jgi:hypothetical protein
LSIQSRGGAREKAVGEISIGSIAILPARNPGSALFAEIVAVKESEKIVVVVGAFQEVAPGG